MGRTHAALFHTARWGFFSLSVSGIGRIAAAGRLREMRCVVTAKRAISRSAVSVVSAVLRSGLRSAASSGIAVPPCRMTLPGAPPSMA